MALETDEGGGGGGLAAAAAMPAAAAVHKVQLPQPRPSAATRSWSRA